MPPDLSSHSLTGAARSPWRFNPNNVESVRSPAVTRRREWNRTSRSTPGVGKRTYQIRSKAK